MILDTKNRVVENISLREGPEARWLTWFESNQMKTLIDLGKSGIVIETVAARSETPDRIRLLKYGFTEIPTKTYARNFIIQVKESGIPIIQEYKQALKESGSMPSDWM